MHRRRSRFYLRENESKRIPIYLRYSLKPAISQPRFCVPCDNAYVAMLCRWCIYLHIIITGEGALLAKKRKSVLRHALDNDNIWTVKRCNSPILDAAHLHQFVKYCKDRTNNNLFENSLILVKFTHTVLGLSLFSPLLHSRLWYAHPSHVE